MNFSSASGGLAQEEIARLIDEAQQFASIDKQRRDLVELMNKADGLVYSTERTLEEYAEHIGEDERQGLASALEKTRAALTSHDAPGLAIAVDELSALSYQMTEQLYAKLGSNGSE